MNRIIDIFKGDVLLSSFTVFVFREVFYVVWKFMVLILIGVQYSSYVFTVMKSFGPD